MEARALSRRGNDEERTAKLFQPYFDILETHSARLMDQSRIETNTVVFHIDLHRTVLGGDAD